MENITFNAEYFEAPLGDSGRQWHPISVVAESAAAAERKMRVMLNDPDAELRKMYEVDENRF